MPLLSDTFILRTPTFSYDKFRSLDVLDSPLFNEAVYLASPNFYEEVAKKNHKERNSVENLVLSLYRYTLRMYYRCTPFGLFAGISIGSISDQADIQLSPTTQYKKYTRLDTHFLSSFVQQILKDDTVRDEIHWFANNSIYQVSDKLRFIEFKIDKDVRSHHLANVDNSEFVQLVLSQARQGATIAELADSLVNDEISFEEAKAFVNEIIETCLLISELEPMVTGKEYHAQLLENLKDIPSCNKYFQRLQNVVLSLKEADEKGVGISTEYYEKITDEVKQWQIDFDPGKLFQCDLLKPTHKCQISTLVTDELGKAISLLEKIMPPPVRSNLTKFIEEFEKRYESQEVPLLTVLDADTGIGYPANEQAYADNAPLLVNLQLGNESQSNTNSYNVTKWQKFITQKYQNAIAKNLTEIEIKGEEIKLLLNDDDTTEDSTPNSMYSLCSLLASSGEEVDKGNFLIDHEITAGPSAANLLGRFCYMDNELTRLTRELLLKEERAKPDAIFAEVLHIPQARLANVSMRPVLREYEIPILTRPSVDEDHTVLLHDLMVSIRNRRIFLRSQKLNKEVVPRLSTAHNFSLNPVPHYHFLCDLQFQGIKRNLHWDWGFLNEFAYLPRVRYGKTILAKARWRILLSDISANKNFKENELEGLIKLYFASNKIPNRVTISQGDNQLPIDIENDYCLKILVKDLKKFETIDLNECLFNESNLLVRGPEGGYTNEIIIPWTKQVETTPNSSHYVQVKQPIEVQRSFLSGDKWQYVKIYCGVKTADNVLIEVLKPITEQLLADGMITKWFFIHYADPDYHIRIRFLGEGNFHAAVTERLNAALVNYMRSNLIWKVQTDTYTRELERYGEANIENSETLFFFDSMATVKILSLLEGDEGDNLRWQLALKGVDDLLQVFNLNVLEKRDLMQTMSTNFLAEFKVDNSERRDQLSLKFRAERKTICFILENEMDEAHEFFPLWKIFRERREKLRHCAEFIDSYLSSSLSTITRNDLLASYAHMFLNRFLRSKQRMQEMVIYYYLHQYYRSLVARNVEQKS